MIESLSPRRKWAVILLLALAHIYFFGIFPGFISPNELSRLLLVSAVVDDGTLQIDKALIRYGDTDDKATYNGHYYSDKAIGTSLLAIPGFALMRLIERLTGVVASTTAALFWMKLIAVIIPSLAFAAFFARTLFALRPGEP